MMWFATKCPVDDETREWLHVSWKWLSEELGPEIPATTEVVLPTEEHFPDPYNGSRASIRTMVDRVCSFMDVDPELIEVRFEEGEDAARFHPLAASGDTGRHALGTYQMRRDGKHAITLNIEQASNPEMLVATVAHELGHVILLGEGRLDPEHPDHEPLTDLLTVFYGLGVFNANTTVIFEQWTNSQYQGWRIGGGGYLSEEAFGYALALFARDRGETKPQWAKYLNTNVRTYFRKSLKYLSQNY
jgi:hypothetical protein